MNPKDIRDISAYWGAKCTLEVRTHLGFSLTDTTVCGILDYLVYSRTPVQYGGNARNLKLHLRPFQSLTSEEVGSLLKLVGATHIPATDAYWDEGERCWMIGNYDLYFLDNGLVLSGDGSDGNEIGTVGSPAAVVAYLQSIGVYVPGTIDEKYVELIPDKANG